MSDDLYNDFRSGLSDDLFVAAEAHAAHAVRQGLAPRLAYEAAYESIKDVLGEWNERGEAAIAAARPLPHAPAGLVDRCARAIAALVGVVEGRPAGAATAATVVAAARELLSEIERA